MNDARKAPATPAAAIGACFHTFVFGLYPFLIVLGANAGVLPLHGPVLFRAAAITVLLTAAILFLFKPLIPELPARAACLSFVFIGFNLYAALSGTSTHPGLAILYTLVCIGFALVMVRPWQARGRKTGALNLGAFALLAVYAYAIVPAIIDDESWRHDADALIDTVASSTLPSDPRGDIYYVILDGFGRPDILKERYNLDLDQFVAALDSRGFQVPARAQSNYAQTFLSLSSSLNLSYLDTVAGPMAESNDRRLLDYLIQSNALMKLARRAGYRIIGIGSDYAATEELTAADHCHCEQFGLHEIEATILNLTPLRALPLNRWTYGTHRRKIEESFRHLRDAASEQGPKLVFAHLLAPHPPFVFGPDGRPASNSGRMYSFGDGSQYPGSRDEYAAGYRNQAKYVAGQILAVIDAILSRPGTRPIIVVHGDHGPGSTREWSDLRGDRGRERMGIFSAYYLRGDQRPALPANLTPVNGMRIMVNRAFNTTLPQLPNVSLASTWQQPYKFEVVAPATSAVAGRLQ
jgi:hypothetical protein